MHHRFERDDRGRDGTEGFLSVWNLSCHDLTSQDRTGLYLTSSAAPSSSGSFVGPFCLSKAEQWFELCTAASLEVAEEALGLGLRSPEDADEELSS